MMKKYQNGNWKRAWAITLLFIFSLAFNNLFAVTITSIADGNWTDGTTWDLGRMPTAGDDVIIATKVINNDEWAEKSVNSITINAGAVYTENDNALYTVTGDVTINGSYLGRVYKIKGTFTVNDTAKLKGQSQAVFNNVTVNKDAYMSFLDGNGGSDTINGTFTIAGTVVQMWNGKAILNGPTIIAPTGYWMLNPTGGSTKGVVFGGPSFENNSTQDINFENTFFTANTVFKGTGYLNLGKTWITNAVTLTNEMVTPNRGLKIGGGWGDNYNVPAGMEKSVKIINKGTLLLGADDTTHLWDYFRKFDIDVTTNPNAFGVETGAGYNIYQPSFAFRSFAVKVVGDWGRNITLTGNWKIPDDLLCISGPGKATTDLKIEGNDKTDSIIGNLIIYGSKATVAQQNNNNVNLVLSGVKNYDGYLNSWNFNFTFTGTGEVFTATGNNGGTNEYRCLSSISFAGDGIKTINAPGSTFKYNDWVGEPVFLYSKGTVNFTNSKFVFNKRIEVTSLADKSLLIAKELYIGNQSKLINTNVVVNDLLTLNTAWNWGFDLNGNSLTINGDLIGNVGDVNGGLFQSANNKAAIIINGNGPLTYDQIRFYDTNNFLGKLVINRNDTVKVSSINISDSLVMTNGIYKIADWSSLTYGPSAKLIYNGTTAQTTSQEWLSNLSVPVVINNTSLEGVSLLADKKAPAITINGLLNVGDKVLTAGSISGTSYDATKMIGLTTGRVELSVPAVGNIIVPVGTIGTANIYSGVSANFTSLPAPIVFKVQLNATKHPSNAFSTITYLNKYWTLAADGGNFSADMKFAFDNSDLVGNLADLYTGQYANTSWNVTSNQAQSNQLSINGVDKACDITGVFKLLTYTLTVNQGSGSGTYAADVPVNITANPPATGKAFDAWTGDVTGVADVHSASTTLTMPAGNVSLTATYKDVNYTITVAGGTSSVATAILGASVTLTADAPATGKAFDAWTGDVAGIADVHSASTTLTMPAANVSVTASYKDVTAVPELHSESVKVYPNPSTGIFYLQMPAGCNNIHVSVSDITGKIVTESLLSINGQVAIDLTGKTAGIYLVRLQNGNNSIVKKVVLK
jgi:uncharacterized repeat protein (TIGR02543 family)